VIDPAQALQGALRPAPDTARPAVALRTALVVGAAGRLGEAVLERLAGRGPVFVAVRARFESTFAHVQPWAMAEGAPGHATLPPVDDLWCVGSGGATDASFHRRDAAYRAFDPAETVELARAARLAGVRRLIVVAPLAALHQLDASALGLADLDEARIAAMGFEAVVFVRPTPAEHATRSGPWLERVAQWWLGTLAHYLTPKTLAPLTSDVAARAMTEAVADLVSGNHVVGAQRLHAVAGERKGRGAAIRR
jgi:hypothetical protein